MTADINTLFCTLQNVSGNGTTVQSTDWIDGKVAQDWAGGVPPDVEIIVGTAPTGGTSQQFQLCAVASDGTNASPAVILATTMPILIANLTAGSRHILRVSPIVGIPAATLTHLRLQTVNVGNNANGTISAQLVPIAATTGPAKAYPAAY